MSQEKRARLKELRQKLANLSSEDRERLTKHGLIATVEGRTLSLQNTLLLYMQTPGVLGGNGCQLPSVVGGYRQWLKAGKHVRKGEHGRTIFFPVGDKDEDGEITEAHIFYTATVFDIAQVEDNGKEPEDVSICSQ